MMYNWLTSEQPNKILSFNTDSIVTQILSVWLTVILNKNYADVTVDRDSNTVNLLSKAIIIVYDITFYQSV